MKRKEFNPKPGYPGTEINGYEVWALAPRNCRWVIDGDGYRLVHVSGADKGGDIPRGDSRRLIVAEMQKRRKEVVADRLAPRGGKPVDYWEWSRLRTLALNWACEVIAHELYPDYYPEPVIPEELSGLSVAA